MKSHWPIFIDLSGPVQTNYSIDKSIPIFIDWLPQVDRSCAGPKTISDSTSVHTQERWFRPDFCNGTKMRPAEVEEGSPHIRKVSVPLFGALWTCVHTIPDISFSCRHEKQSVNPLNPRSKGLRSGESARLPPIWPGFKSRRRRHMWVEFVVGSLLCSERYSGFPLSSKTNISKFQFDQESGRRRTTLWMCYLQIIIYYLFILYQNWDSNLLFLYFFSRSSGENSLKYQLHSSSLIMHSILMTTLLSKALIL